jgi:putative RNA 2'-phosphotransferase
MKNLENIGKFLSLILRHQPQTVGIQLDKHGWANIEELLEGMSNHGQPVDMQTLEYIVANNDKKRYSFNDDKTLIRANQGHSIHVDVELEEKEPPEYLYHGTSEKYVSSIEKIGLLPKSRLYVHLSKEFSTAENVGKRHGSPVVYKILSGEMHKDGYNFYLSVNGVWLTKQVPVKYLQKIAITLPN